MNTPISIDVRIMQGTDGRVYLAHTGNLHSIHQFPISMETLLRLRDDASQVICGRGTTLHTVLPEDTGQ